MMFARNIQIVVTPSPLFPTNPRLHEARTALVVETMIHSLEAHGACVSLVDDDSDPVVVTMRVTFPTLTAHKVIVPAAHRDASRVAECAVRIH